MMRRIAVAAANFAGRYGSRACPAMEVTQPLYRRCDFNEGGLRSIKTHAARRKSSTAVVKEAHTAPRRLTSNKPKTAGRNSAGRITAFHRGGGAKRLYRKIDLKRNTPSIGVVERIEYDPNRSSNIALVRWSEGMHPPLQRKHRTAEMFAPPSEILAPKETNIRGQFSFASMSKMNQGTTASCVSTRPMAASVVVGLPTAMPASSKGSLTSDSTASKIAVNDIFLSTFSRKAKGGSVSSSSPSVGLPRVAVVGAKPAFYAPLMRENGGDKNTFSLSEIKKWNSTSSVWAHRLKRKAAVSWHCHRFSHAPGLAGIGEFAKQRS